MIHDIELSKDTNREFKASPVSKPIEEAKVEFTVETLKDNSLWFGYLQEHCILPPEMKELTTKFETFYK